MRLTEAEGKAILARHGVARPRGALLQGDSLPAGAGADAWPGLVLKAQIPEGGRGKRGLVRRVTAAELPAARAAMLEILGDPEAGFLLEEAAEIERELYLALRVDGTAQTIEAMIGPEGGVEVESNVASLIRASLDPEAPGAAEAIFARLGDALPPSLAARVAREAVRLARVMAAEDLSLLEINPLAVVGGRLVALDCKMERDDAAAFRHDRAATAASARLESRALTPLEREARTRGFALVELPGDVALVTAGAGLGMLMMDLLADEGLTAACFMDNLVGGPADTTEARLEAAWTLAERAEVKAILFYTTLASRPLGERVDHLLGFLANRPAPKPVYAGFAAAPSAARGLDLDAARARLRAAGVVALHEDPRELVRAVAAA
ncbi:ATP-grasp domain-containing protein [Muricoccus radiodurans]|uniref:ATP-grasp domain-containing protein n=1 Tax=Muricoccus radiodurans TaxID=2231721 RepID=UPI003CF5FA4D